MPDEIIQEKRQALEDAVRDYLAVANEGAYLTDYVIFAAGADPADSQGTRYGFWASQSPVHTLRGLISVGEEELFMCTETYVSGDDAD